MSNSEPWTIGRLLAWTTDYLKQSGAASPRLDAEVLLATAIGCERIQLYTSFNEPASEETRTAFRELVRRRAEGIPVAYLVGHREFYSLSFRVTPAVLIPRPETEHVVIETLDLLKALPDGPPLDIVDVGTGSGVIAICLARQTPRCRLQAVDISPEALEVARKNAEDHAVADRIQFSAGDLLSNFPPQPQFDVVVSNPPYVSDSELAEAAREVRDQEPHLALRGGSTGAEIIARLIPQAGQRLRAQGWLIMEISPLIELRVRDLIRTCGQFAEPIVVKDLAGLARVIRCQRTPSSPAAPAN